MVLFDFNAKFVHKPPTLTNVATKCRLSKILTNLISKYVAMQHFKN